MESDAHKLGQIKSQVKPEECAELLHRGMKPPCAGGARGLMSAAHTKFTTVCNTSVPRTGIEPAA